MADVWLLQLEVDDNGTTKILSFTKNVEAAGKATEKAGRQSEASRLGIIAFGDAVQNSAQAIGIHGQASRQLGNSVERMAFSVFPAWGTALGVGILAATAAVGVWTHLVDRNRKLAEETKKAAEEKSKLRDETIKAAGAAMTWLIEADKAIKKTEALTRAENELRKAEHGRNLDKLDVGIFEQEKKVLDLRNKLTLFSAAESKYRGESVLQTRLLTGLEKNSLDYEEKSLSLMLARRGAFANFTGNEEDPRDFEERQKREITATADSFSRQAAYYQALDQLRSAEDANYAGHLNMQLAAFDAMTNAEMNRMLAADATGDQLSAAWATREIQRATIVANEKKRLALEEMQFKQMAWQYGEQIIGELAVLAVQHGKQGAESAKNAARVQTIVSTAAGAMKAYEQLGAYGGYAAALIIAAGAVQLAKINAASYGSGGGGGMTMGGAAVSGSDNYRYFNYEQSQYGSGWRPGMGQGWTGNEKSGNTTIIIQAMDSKSFEQYVNDNPNAVLKVVDKKNKGYL